MENNFAGYNQLCEIYILFLLSLPVGMRSLCLTCILRLTYVWVIERSQTYPILLDASMLKSYFHSSIVLLLSPFGLTSFHKRCIHYIGSIVSFVCNMPSTGCGVKSDDDSSFGCKLYKVLSSARKQKIF